MYHNGRSYQYYVEDNKDFVPKFLDEADPAVLAEAEGHCNGSTNLPCLFDFVYTRNAELASQTLETEQQAQITAEELGMMNLPVRNLTIWVSDQNRHKRACTISEAG